MILEAGYIEDMSSMIEENLEIYKKTGVEAGIDVIWGCENVGDFMCGFFAGQMVGSMFTVFRMAYKRRPTEEEHQEIMMLIEMYTEEINELFVKLND